jgi:hypothetical protein
VPQYILQHHRGCARAIITHEKVQSSPAAPACVSEYEVPQCDVTIWAHQHCCPLEGQVKCDWWDLPWTACDGHIPADAAQPMHLSQSSMLWDHCRDSVQSTADMHSGMMQGLSLLLAACCQSAHMYCSLGLGRSESHGGCIAPCHVYRPRQTRKDICIINIWAPRLGRACPSRRVAGVGLCSCTLLLWPLWPQPHLFSCTSAGRGPEKSDTTE